MCQFLIAIAPPLHYHFLKGSIRTIPSKSNFYSISNIFSADLECGFLPPFVEVNRGVGGVFNEYDFGLRVEVEVVAGGKASDQYTPFYHR